MTHPVTFDYYLVLDFEATCVEDDCQWLNGIKSKWPNEVIEFPIVALNARTGNIDAEFREYVRPVLNPELTPFCVELTGITQDLVDPADTFENVFQRAQRWINDFHDEHRRTNPNLKTILVTCGDWDLESMLPKQARISNVKVPEYFQRWVNIKKIFQENILDKDGQVYKRFGMPTMLDVLELPLVGRHHSGLDDSRNIACIVLELLKRNYTVRQTGEWSAKVKRELSD